MDSFDSPSRLAKIVNSLKRQKNIYTVLRGLLIFTALFLASFTIASILSALYENPYLLAALKTLILLISAYFAVKFIITPIYRDPNNSSLLKKLEEHSTGLGEDTLNAIELSDKYNQSLLHGTSESLAHAHISKTTSKLESLSLSALYPLRNLRKYMISLVAVLVLTITTSFISPSNFGSYLFSMNLLPQQDGNILELADIEILLNFPDYSELEPILLKGGSEDIEVIKGSKVQFKAKPLRKISSAALIIKNGPSVPVKKNGNQITAEFSVLDDSSFYIQDSAHGRNSKLFNVRVKEDSKPAVKIYSPAGDNLELGSEEQIHIFYEAQDDFKISKMTLGWENQKELSEATIKAHKDSAKEIKGSTKWGPAGINPEDGDTIKLRVYAYDNNSISGPGIGVSNPITIKLKDARSKHKENLRIAEQFMEELINILGDDINLFNEGKETLSSKNTDAGKDKIDRRELRDKQTKLTRKIENALRTLDLTLSGMTEDEYSDYTFFLGLSNMDIRINELLDERKFLLESYAKLDIKKLQGLMEREITEFENDILLLDSILKADKLIDSLRSSNELFDQYKELSELLSKMKDGGNEEIAKQIEEKIRHIQDLMTQLAKQIEGLGGEIQEGFLNKDAFEALNMQKQLDQIVNMAKEGNIEAALEMLAKMTQNMQNMMASLENGMQSFGSSMMTAQMSKLNDLISRIENIEREESSLKDKTQELKETLLNNPLLSDNNLRDFIDRELEKTSALKQSLNQARAKLNSNSPEQSAPEGAYLLEKMIEKTQELENWLKAMDFNEADKQAKSVQESTLGLKEMSNIDYGSLGKAFDDLSSANTIANEIRDDLKKFESDGGVPNQFDKMAGRQDEIKSETGELISELSDIGSGLFVSPKLGKNLDNAENFMGNASEDLNNKLVSKALSNQEEALKALRQAKQQAQNMMQQMQMSASGNGSSAPMMLGQGQSGNGVQGKDTRYVEIPQVDEDLVGKEYKQKIIESMKGGSPEGYIELNKKYYDRIIK